MMGPELNFAFRMEKVAGSLAVPFCFSASAAAVLSQHLPLEPVAGEHELKGFKGQHRFFAWA
jgi:class 3 adenylate cyclase